jgi:hypothetical protein
MKKDAFSKIIIFLLCIFIMKRDMLIVFSLFLIIILISLWFSSTPTYIPYSSSISSNHANFEAFGTLPLEYSTVSKNTALDGGSSNYLIQSDKSGCKSVMGYEGAGLFCDPNAKPISIDIYSDAEGSLTCQGYGYTNSRGSLCLTEKKKAQLSTRGMNSTGSPSVIGGSSV